MPVTFHCTTCGKKFAVLDDLIGKRIRCKGCQHVMQVPAESDLEEVAAEWIVECDGCGRQHRPPDELAGKRIRCKCGEVIRLSRTGTAEPQLAPLSDDPVARPDPLNELPAVETTTPDLPAPGLPNPDYSTGGLPGQVPPPVFGAQSAQAGPATRADRDKRESAILRKAASDDAWRKTPTGDQESFEWFNGGLVAGFLMIVGGLIWLVAGIIFLDRLFYFAPVLVVAGIVSMIRGLL